MKAALLGLSYSLLNRHSSVSIPVEVYAGRTQKSSPPAPRKRCAENTKRGEDRATGSSLCHQAGVCQRGIRPLFASTKKTALSPGQRAPTPGLLGTRPGDRRTRRRTRPSRALETTKDGVGVSLFSAVSAGRALSPTGAGPRPRHFRPREETPQDREDNRKVSAASSIPQTRGLQPASGPVTASEVASSAAAPPA